MPLKSDFSVDRLYAVNPRRAGQAAMAVCDRLQGTDLTKEQQIAGVSVLFLALCDQYGIHPGNALQVGENLLGRAYAEVPELRAGTRFVRDQL